jgi:hypothetical protein
MRSVHGGAIALVLLAAACGDSSPAGGGPQGGAGGGPSGGAEEGGAEEGGSGGAASLVPLTVELIDFESRAALASVPCALVKPGGERAEAATGADGKVTFADLDWSLGVASVVCVPGNGTGYLSFNSVDAPNGVLTLQGSQLAEAPPAVAVSGTAQNPTAAGSTYLVQATAGLTRYQATSPNFDISVESGAAFDLFGLEFKVANNPAPHGFGQDFLAWTSVSSPALTDDATIDLDFSDTVVPLQAAGTVGLPTDPDSPFLDASAYGYLYVTPVSRYFEVLLGFPTRSSYTADGRLAFEAESIGSLFTDA